jgi:Rho GTPase-activating protein 1
MDAYNLAIVFTPNLVSNDNPLKAVQMSMVSSPDSASQHSKDILSKGDKSSKPLTSQPPTGGPLGDSTAAPGGTTLGTVIRFCIEHYYEIFDEIRDVSEAVPEEAFDISSKDLPTDAELPTPKPSDVLGVAAKRSTGTRPTTTPVTSTSAAGASKYQGRARGPAGPPPSAASASMALLAKALAEGFPQVPATENTSLLQRSRTQSYGPPSGPGRSQVLLQADSITNELPHAQQNLLSVDRQGWLSSAAQSVSFQSGSAGGPSRSGWSGRGPTGMPKTRSIISIEKDSLPKESKATPMSIGKAGAVRGLTSGKESIKLGRSTITSGGTVRKSASAGVMGVSVTANGFFTSPQASSP